MVLVEVLHQEICDPEIRDRYANRSPSDYARHYLATASSTEIGFVAVDIWPSDTHPVEERFVIYDIFVPTALRRRGIGGRLLEAAEDIAKQMGYEWTLLIPKSLDSEFEQEAIEHWYSSKGYIPLGNGGRGQVIKRLI